MIKAGITKLLRLEDGAITVDWVVLTASVVALGAIVGAVIWSNTGNAAMDIATYIGAQPVKTTF